MIEVLISNKSNYLLFLICYFIGSIPFGYIFYKIIKKDDIRNHGSGNIGATNVNRLIGKKFGFITLFLDFLKTFCPCLIMHKYFGTEVGVVSGFLTILGHIYPIWLKFKGGKGVAVYVGIILALSFKLALIFGATWLIVLFLFRYSSLSSILASLSLIIYNLFFDNNFQNIFLILFFLIIIYTHKQNILRIKDKKETKIKF